MKTLILTLSLICSTTFAAGFDSLQTEMARTVAQVNAIDAQIKSIKLNESGVLTVTKMDGTFKSIKLSQNNSQVMLTVAKALSEVEPQTETRTAVCEIMINKLFDQKLSIINTDSNALKLMLTSSSCANVSYTRPEDSASLNAALDLKAQMITLAREVVQN